MYHVIGTTQGDEFPTILGMYTDKDEANDHYNELQVSGEYENPNVLEPSQDIGF